MDPEVNQRDVGGDPLAFAARRLALSQELFDRLQARTLPSGEHYESLTRNFVSGLGQMGRAFEMVAKYVGGVVYLRDQAGSGRAPYTPVPAARQRAALKLLSERLFAVDGFQLTPAFASRLVDDALDRGYTPPLDRSLEATLLAQQTAVLDRLLSPTVATRLVNSRNKLADGAQALTLDELYGTLTRAIWGERVVDVTPARRALQREHARRLAAAIAKPGLGAALGDARALHRATAKTLLARAREARGNTRLSPPTRAHLDETIDTLDTALKAQAVRVVG